MTELTNRARRFHRDELRGARARALADAEGYASPLHAIERLGRQLDRTAHNLGRAARALATLASMSPYARELPAVWRVLHAPFPELLSTVRDYRNDVMHVGARARHLTTHAVEVCLILEDALQAGLNTVADFMVPDPVIAERWQPLSYLRRQMLEHSFTFIPLRPESPHDDWQLIADHQLARYLSGRDEPGTRLRQLAESIADAIDNDLETSEAEYLDAFTAIEDAREAFGAHPRLVREGDRVVGIITAFDLL